MPAGPEPTLRARLAQAARDFVATAPVGATAAQEREYLAYARDTNARNARVFFLGTTVGNLLWWLTDPVVYHAQPVALRQYATYRPIVSAVGLAMFLLVDRVPALLQRRPVTVLAAGGAVMLGVVALGLGALGPPSQAWFGYLYLAPVATVLVSCAFWPRVALITAVVASAVLGYFGPHPAYWRDPNALAVVSFLTFAASAGVVAGVNSERTRRTNFFVRQSLAQRSFELHELNEELEQRVDAKTAELRALAAHLETAREDERARIARDLHDELGQELTAARYAVANARRRYAREPAAVEPDLAEIDRQLAHTAAVTREIMVDLRPRVLDDLGLGAALEWLARRAEARGAVACALDVPAGCDAALRPGLVVAAFRIVQESLNNAVKYANAAHVTVAVRRDATHLRVSVQDDGEGFDTAAPPRRDGHASGFGLVGMRERARALGGEFAVESAPGRGTVVRADLPIDDDGARNGSTRS